MERRGQIKRAVQEYYMEDAGRFYEQTRFQGLGGQARNRRELKTIEALTRDVAGRRVLAVGCGTGRFSENLLERGAVVTGADFSPKMLAFARERLAGRAGFNLARCDAEFLPFGDESFDGLLCVKVISHFVAPEGALKEFCRVVKKGGWVIVDANNLFRLDFPLVFLKKYFNVALCYFAQKNMYSTMLAPWQIKRAYRAEGLRRRDITGVGLLPKFNFLLRRWGVERFAELDMRLCRKGFLRYVAPMSVLLFKKE